MSVYPLPLMVGPSEWQDNGTILYPIANRDVAILATRKLLLDGPLGNDYLTCPSDGVLSAYLAGVLKFQLSAVNGLVMTDGKMLSGVVDGAAAIAYTLDTTNNLTTAGARIYSLRNQGIEKFVITKDGFVTFGTSANRLQLGSGNVGTYLYGNYVPGASTTRGSRVDVVCSTGAGTGNVYPTHNVLTLNTGTNIQGFAGMANDVTINTGATVTTSAYGYQSFLTFNAGSIITPVIRGVYCSTMIYGTATAGVENFYSYISPKAGSTIGGTLYGIRSFVVPDATAATLGIYGIQHLITLPTGATTTGSVYAINPGVTIARPITGSVSVLHNNFTFSAGANVSGATYGVYTATNVASGATLTGAYRGRHHGTTFNTGAVVGSQIHGSFDQLNLSCATVGVYGKTSELNLNAGFSNPGSPTIGVYATVRVNTGVSVVAPLGSLNEVNFTDSIATGYPQGVNGQVNVGGGVGSTVNGAYGSIGAVSIFAGSKSTVFSIGLMGYIWLDQTTNPETSPAAAAIEAMYATPGISLNSAITVGTANRRAAVVGYVLDSANTIPHAAFLAFTTNDYGDGAAHPAAFKAVDCRTIAGKGWNYGLDLFMEPGLNNGIKLADIRGHAGNTIKNLVAGTWESNAAVKATGLTLAIVTKAFADTGYIATVADYTILGNAALGAVVLNLPTAVGISGRIHNFVKIDATANAVTVTPNGAETISGAASKILAAQWATVTVQSNGTNWIIL